MKKLLLSLFLLIIGLSTAQNTVETLIYEEADFTANQDLYRTISGYLHNASETEIIFRPFLDFDNSRLSLSIPQNTNLEEYDSIIVSYTFMHDYDNNFIVLHSALSFEQQYYPIYPLDHSIPGTAP